MNIRNYNVYFSTHTISGIITCALLYIIFFAGSFSFFRKEISAWQKDNSLTAYQVDPAAYVQFLDSINTSFPLHGRDISFLLQDKGANAFIRMSASNDSALNKQNEAKLKSSKPTKPQIGRRAGPGDSKSLGYDFKHKAVTEYSSSYDLGEFLYRLHFLAQLNEVPIRLGFAPFGYFIAGLTSFIFLFALITGLMLHWDKIVSNFFVFRPFNKWKTVWTDMHTALGVIGFPFQFMYAVTGIFLILHSVLAIPFTKVLYDGDNSKMLQELGYNPESDFKYSYIPLQSPVDINYFFQEAKKKYPDSELKKIVIKNYGDQGMYITFISEPHFNKSFAGSGVLTYRVHDKKLIDEKSPMENPTYIDKVKSLLYRLHLGDYGGYPLKVVYFILGIMGCLVITSGILIWLVARDKNNVIPRKRKFNLWMANFFMAICLTMLPVTALTFIMVKLSLGLAINVPVDQSFIYKVYFYAWLVFVVYYTFRKSINRTNRECLFIGGILAMIVPLVNGIISGNWIWLTFYHHKTDIFIVDLLWLFIGMVSLFAYLKTKQYFAVKP